MPDGMTPFIDPDAHNIPGFDLEAELRRCARSIIHQRHPDIPEPLLDDLIANDEGLRAEYDALIDQMRQPVRPSYPRRGGRYVF